MNTRIKATQMTLTDGMRARIENIAAKFEKVAASLDDGTLGCAIEVGSITKHHRHGNVFRAEIHLSLGDKLLRATAAGDTASVALTAARDAMKGELERYKQQRQSKRRAGSLRSIPIAG